MPESKNELKRIKEAYERRKVKVPSQFYSISNSVNLFFVQEREREILRAFKQYGITSLEDKRMLDIGCGTGWVLRNFIQY